MKISLVGPVYPYRGGISHYLTTLSQKLTLAGHAVQTISFKRQYPHWLYPGESDKDPSSLHDQVPARYTLDPFYFWTWYQAVHQIQAFHPDLVIIQWWTTFWAPAFAMLARWLKRNSIRVIYIIHNVIPHEEKFWDRWLSRLALLPAEMHIVQSEREFNRLRLLLPEAKIRITPLPVYTMLANGRLSREEARTKLDLPVAAPVVLFFGIVRPYKGLRYLIQAFELLKSNSPAAHLLVAGEFWEPIGEYQAMIENLGISDRVHIYNRYIPNEEISTFFDAADLFAAPYTDGTQSASAKLALGFGLPMVLTRCIVDQTLMGREDVWVVQERDAASLSKAVITALEHGRAGRNPVLPPQDDWHKVVRMIEEL